MPPAGRPTVLFPGVPDRPFADGPAIPPAGELRKDGNRFLDDDDMPTSLTTFLIVLCNYSKNEDELAHGTLSGFHIIVDNFSLSLS